MSGFITIKGFHNLTPQELFDMSLRHVRKNGKPSANAGGSCRYGGIGCGAAPFLAEVPGTIEGKGWDSLVEIGVVQDHQSLLVRKLQSCHDKAFGISRGDVVGTAASNANFMKYYEIYMKKLAAEFRLSYTPPEK